MLNNSIDRRKPGNFTRMALALVVLAWSGCKFHAPFECDTDADCEDGYCHRGACFKVTCKDDSGCLGGRTCLAEKCVANCGDPRVKCGENMTCDDSTGKVACIDCEKQAYRIDSDGDGYCVGQAQYLCQNSVTPTMRLASSCKGDDCNDGDRNVGGRESDVDFCSRLGKDCDVVSATDNCGASHSVNCGSCASPHVCTSNVCGGCSAPNPPSDQDLPKLTKYMPTADLVIDSVTKLVWQRNVDHTTRAFGGARDYCPGLALAGCSGWRLPTKTELETLLITGGDYPHTNIDAFHQMIEATADYYVFWTSTVNTDSIGGTVFGVNFLYGKSSSGSVYNVAYVRCVR